MPLLRQNHLSSYDWPAKGTIVDVGGGNGLLLSQMLPRATPGLQGVLFDLPHVVEQSQTVLRAAGVACRFCGHGKISYKRPAVDRGDTSFVKSPWVRDGLRNVAARVSKWPTSYCRGIGCFCAVLPLAASFLARRACHPMQPSMPVTRSGSVPGSGTGAAGAK